MEVGAHIRVKKGVEDPDFKKRDLSGHTGHVSEIDDDDLICVVWDELSLSRFSAKFIRECDYRNLDHTRIYLSQDDVEVIENEPSRRGWSWKKFRSDWLGKLSAKKRLIKRIGEMTEDEAEEWFRKLN